MGGATVLMASDLELPENVKGILADSPYTTPKAIIKKVARDMHLPPAISCPIKRPASPSPPKSGPYSAPAQLKSQKRDSKV
jgi:hypothetical protein